jgi:tRNA nucleotidyltransferase/poly(A) polymerase
MSLKNKNRFSINNIIETLKYLYSVPEITKIDISGNDIMSMFNIKPSKLVGELLLAAESFYIEKDFKPTKEEIITYLKNNY